MSGEDGSAFVGTWKLETSENFEKYLEAVDVGFVMRKMALLAKPDVIISIDGDTWTLRYETPVTTNENTFKLNEQFDENTPDGRKVKSVLTLVGPNKLEHQQTGHVSSTITRELTDDDTLIATCVAKGVTCKRVYKRED